MDWYLYLYLLLAGLILVISGILLKKIKTLVEQLNTTIDTANSIQNKTNNISAKLEYTNEVRNKVITNNSKKVITGIVLLDGLERLFNNKEQSKGLIKKSTNTLVDTLRILSILK